MPSIMPKQPALYSIYSLAEVPAKAIEQMPVQEIIEIYLVMQGRVKIDRRDYGIVLPANSVYCINCHRQDRTDIEEGTVGYVIRFSKILLYSGDHEWYNPCFTDFHAMVLREEALPVEAAFWESAKKIAEMMNFECKVQSEVNSRILAGLLSILLLHIMRVWNTAMSRVDHGAKNTLIRKFNLLLEEKFKTNKKVADYAALLFVTPSYLNDIIKQATGNSASFHIKQRVAMEAVRQAKLTGASMKEVAWRLGFNDNAHFSKFFKKVAGTNFSDIRRVSN